MTPEQYCQNQVLQEGSSLYYSLRILPAKSRCILTALQAFFYEINEIRYTCHEIEVARAKLQWWQNEMAQMFAGQVHHPICQVLSEVNPDEIFSKSSFQKIIEAFWLDLNITHYVTDAELETHCKYTGGILSLLSTQILGYQNETTLKYAEQLGIALQLTKFLRELRRDLAKGRLTIPTEDLERFQVTKSEIFNYQFSEAVQSLLAYQVTRIRAYYHEAFKYLAPEDRANQRSGIIQAQLALATLQEIEEDGYQLFQHQIHLTPLRKLWIAWRTH